MNPKKTIWLITIGEPLPLNKDIRLHRTGLLAEELLKNQLNNVVWWCSSFDHQHKKMLFEKDISIKILENFTLKVLKGFGYKSNVGIRRYFDHIRIARKFQKLSQKENKPECIVVSIPCYNIAYAVIKFAEKNKIPIIIDFRDLWPEIFIDFIKLKWLKNFAELILYFDYKRLAYCFNKASGITAVSKSYLKIAVGKAKRTITENDAIFYLGSKSIDSNCLDPDSVISRLNVTLKNKKIFAFIGSLGLSYDLKIIIDSAKYFENKKNNEVVFIIIGDGIKSDYINKEIKGSTNIYFTGWLNVLEMNSILKLAYCGLMPYVESAKQSIPNKLFDYFSLGLPVISSLRNDEMLEIVKNKNTGLIYNAEEKNSFIQKCNWILDHKEERKVMAENAKQFYMEYGDAKRIYSLYAEYLKIFIQ